jgi:hypothetical protein
MLWPTSSTINMVTAIPDLLPVPDLGLVEMGFRIPCLMDGHIMSCKVGMFHWSLTGSTGVIGQSGHIFERIPLQLR